MNSIENLLSCTECVLFTGIYNVNDFGSSIPNSTGVFVPAKINLCELKNDYNIIGNDYYSGTSALLGSPEFITEVYNLASYPQDPSTQTGFGIRDGLLVWTGTYPNPTLPNGITAASIQSFDISAKSGVYSNVKKVIIDFRDPVIRTMYFIGNLLF